LIVTAIIVAAGKGVRCGGAFPKQFQMIHERPVLYYTLKKFEDSTLVDEVICVVAEEWLQYVSQDIVDRFGFQKITRIVTGGRKRQDSVYQGLLATESNADLVAVHDAARPLVSVSRIEDVIHAADEWGAAVLAVPPRDTITISSTGFIENTPVRDTLWCVQTPQVFRRELLQKAHQKAMQDGFYGTDDSALVEKIGHKVKVIPGDDHNLKITTSLDLQLASFVLGSETTP
jgi:2-C-methyl-D-erythritol 4-phosphate cytidylyltransferase